jgi:Skp family chaperone for outer membrane proteins
VDAVLTAITQSAPQLGISGVLITVIVLLVRREAGAETRHSAELDRITKAHDAELAELRGEMKGLRKQIEDLNTALDLEREQRRTAEDAAAEAARRRQRRGTV